LNPLSGSLSSHGLLHIGLFYTLLGLEAGSTRELFKDAAIPRKSDSSTSGVRSSGVEGGYHSEIPSCGYGYASTTKKHNEEDWMYRSGLFK
jgi:hypothetical protein